MSASSQITVKTNAIGGEIARGENNIVCSGDVSRSNVDDIIVVFIGSAGETRAQRVSTNSSGSFASSSFSLSDAGFSNGDVEIRVIDPGPDGKISDDLTDIDTFVTQINDGVFSGTQTQIVQLIEAEASEDETVGSESVLLRSPEMRITDVVSLSDGSFVTRGETNYPQGETHELALFDNAGDELLLTFFEEWNDSGVWEIPLSTIPDGDYTLTVSEDGSTVDVFQFTAEDVPESQQESEDTGQESTENVSDSPDSDTDGPARDVDSYTSDNLLKRPGTSTGIYGDDVDVIITIGVNKWRVIDGEVNTSKYKESDALKMIVIPDNNDNPGALVFPGNKITVDVKTSSIRGAVDFDRNIMNRDRESARIFTGTIANAIDLGDGAFVIKAFTAEVDLIRTEIPLGRSIDPSSTKELVSIIFNKVNQELSENIEFNIDFDQRDVPYGATHYRSHPIADEINETVIEDEYDPISAAKMLEFIGRKTNSIWWVDSRNVVQFGTTKTSNHKLSFVTDSSAGKQTPPYNGVRVIGDGIASQEGWETKDMISAKFAVSVETLEDIGVPEALIFEYRDDSIKTQEQADNAAKQLLTDLQEQQAEGTVTIVGYPLVKKYDIIEMPDSFGNTKLDFLTVPPAQYAVSAVTHKFGSDGYTTEIECAGVVGRYSGPTWEQIAPEEEGGELRTELENQNQNVSRDPEAPNSGLLPEDEETPGIDRSSGTTL